MSILYPLFLNVQGRFCVVVDGSKMAEGKYASFWMQTPRSASSLPPLLIRLRRGLGQEEYSGNLALMKMETCSKLSLWYLWPTRRLTLRFLKKPKRT